MLQGEKTECILCYEAMSVIKAYNLHRHFDTKHRDKYAKFSIQEKHQIVQEFKGGLQSQQNMFTIATAKNNSFYIGKHRYIVGTTGPLRATMMLRGPR